MTQSEVFPAIGQQRNWKDHTNAIGEYWHPVFWSFVEKQPSLQHDPVWFFERLDVFNLETQTFYLGDSQPLNHEQPLLARYNSGDRTAIRDWVPQLGPTGAGWFILTVQDSDKGPFVIWARQRSEQPEGVHIIKDVN